MRYLVVANRTLGGDHLLSALRERISQGECAIHVLVPASHTASGAFWTEGEAMARLGALSKSELQQLEVVAGQIVEEAAGRTEAGHQGD